MVVELRNQAHRHVLEGERRAVVQFEHPAVGADLNERRDGLVCEGSVGALRQRADHIVGQRAPCEGGEHARGGFDIGVARLRTRDLRPADGRVETAVGGEACEAGGEEIHRFGMPAGRDVLHSFASLLALPNRKRPARMWKSPYITTKAIAIPNQVTE